MLETSSCWVLSKEQPRNRPLIKFYTVNQSSTQNWEWGREAKSVSHRLQNYPMFLIKSSIKMYFFLFYSCSLSSTFFHSFCFVLGSLRWNNYKICLHSFNHNSSNIKEFIFLIVDYCLLVSWQSLELFLFLFLYCCISIREFSCFLSDRVKPQIYTFRQ